MTLKEAKDWIGGLGKPYGWQNIRILEVYSGFCEVRMFFTLPAAPGKFMISFAFDQVEIEGSDLAHFASRFFGERVSQCLASFIHLMREQRDQCRDDETRRRDRLAAVTEAFLRLADWRDAVLESVSVKGSRNAWPPSSIFSCQRDAELESVKETEDACKT